MNKARASVVIAVYNGEKYLKKCVESILAQTMRDFELIVINDGSDDETSIILEEYAKKDSRVIVLSNGENKGIAYSRNRGIERAVSEYIAVIDSDDMAFPERIEKQYQLLSGNYDIDGVGTDFVYVDEKGREFIMKRAKIEEDITLDKLLDNPLTLSHGTMMAKRECFIECGGYRPEFERAVDYDILLRILERYKFVNMIEPQTKIRVSFTSGTLKERSVQLKYSVLAQELAKQRKKEGKDFLQRGDYESFERLKKKIFGIRWKPGWMEASSNYLYWAHRMYHRGPIGYARKLIKQSVRHNPLNLKAWVYMFFLYVGQGFREKLTNIKRVVFR